MIKITRESNRSTLGTGDSKLKVDTINNKSEKRPNPYITNSAHRNPKAYKPSQEGTKRNAKQKKQDNRRTGLLKTKAGQTKIEKDKTVKNAKENSVKSADRKTRGQTANYNEKYDEEKRKSEITNKLLRSKSFKKVKVNEEGGDVNEIMYASFETDCAPEFIACKSDDKVRGTEKSISDETSDDTLKLEYWDNVLKMADEELKKSTDLVELIRNWSIGNSLKFNLSSEDLQTFLNRNKEIHSTDLISRSKYTLLEPTMDSDKITGKCSLVNYSLQLEDESVSIEDEESTSMCSIPKSLSETILNVNQSNSVQLQGNATHYIHELSSNEEIISDSESNVHMKCECNSSDDGNLNLEAKTQSNGNSEDYDDSEIDETVRGWKRRASEIMENEIDEEEAGAVETQKQHVADGKSYHRGASEIEDSESDSSELDEEKLFLITAASRTIDVGSSVENLKSSLNDLDVPCTCSNLNVYDFVSEERSDSLETPIVNTSDNHRKSCNEDDRNDACKYIEEHEDLEISCDTLINDHKNSPVNEIERQCELLCKYIEEHEDLEISCDTLINDHKNSPVNEIERQCELLCTCSEEIFEVDGSKDVYFGEDISGLIINCLMETSCPPNETDSYGLCSCSCSCTNLNSCEHTKSMQEMCDSSDSVNCNLVMENTQIKNSDAHVFIDEFSSSNEEDSSSEKSTKENLDSENISFPHMIDEHNDANSITNLDECINEEFIHMLINEYIDIGLNGTEPKSVVGTEEIPCDSDKEVPVDDRTSNDNNMAKLSKIFGNGAEVIGKSSLPSLLGVSAAMFTAAVGVIYFWHSASGIIQ